jgi:hypothetical protein
MDIDHPVIETNPQQSSSSSSQNLGGDSEEGAETKNPSNVSPRGLQRKLTKERRKFKEIQGAHLIERSRHHDQESQR